MKIQRHTHLKCLPEVPLNMRESARSRRLPVVSIIDVVVSDVLIEVGTAIFAVD